MNKKEQQITQSDLTIPARDGYELAATLYEGAQPSKRFILINSATAVPRQFYKSFASYLVEQGFSVLTYDYRGINGSRPKKLRGFKAKMRDWALQDMAGVIDWMKNIYEPKQLFLIGHSVGGQVAGMLDNVSDVDGMVTLSAQSGNWRYQGGNQKLAVLLHSYISLPLLATLVGYMPWSWFGGEDLPKTVAVEWAGWCRNKDYILGDKSLPLERYDEFSAPVLAYSIADDNWGTAKSVDMMMRAYPNRTRRHVSPKEAGLKSLGHFGFFRPTAKPLWGDTVNWLNAV